MNAARMAAERKRRDHGGDTWPAESGGDSRSRAEAEPTVTVRIPLEFRQRRGRKVLVAPDGAGQERRLSPRASVLTGYETTPTIRALARAFRWRKLLETGAVATIQEIAAAENINPSYVSRVLRLTLLSPDNVASVLNSRTEPGAADLLASIPTNWSEQDPA